MALPPVDQVVPLRDEIVQRTAGNHSSQLRPGLAEGHAALHTPGALALPLLLGERQMKLAKWRMLQWALRPVHFGVVKFQKSRGLSHY